jgi:hypothetical protein
MITEKQNVDNMKKCPSFERCSVNHCPLDCEMSKRYGSGNCKYMTEAKAAKIAGNNVVFGGKTMPDEMLKVVPESNISSLNTPSRKRLKDLISHSVKG